ncbi:MAG: hypothetical protein GY827_04600 [Cytophagales bacterium]|nr:hypothetical protein [Cytophagales bacterium]
MNTELEIYQAVIKTTTREELIDLVNTKLQDEYDAKELHWMTSAIKNIHLAPRNQSKRITRKYGLRGQALMLSVYGK